MLLSRMTGTPSPRLSMMFVRSVTSPGFVRSGALGEQAAQSLVASGLPIAEAVDSQGVCDGARRVDLQTILEQPQTNLGPVNGVVPMGDGIRHGLEHRSHVVLGTIYSTRGLKGRGRHVLDDEAAGFHDLPIQRSGQVCSVELIRRLARAGADLVTRGRRPLAHMRWEASGGAHRSPSAHRRPSAARFLLLPHLRFPACGETYPDHRRNVESGTGSHSCGVRFSMPEPSTICSSNRIRPGLAALLEQPGEVLGGHGPLGICHAVQEAAGAAVDKQAAGNLDLDHCHIVPGPGGQPQPVQYQVG